MKDIRTGGLSCVLTTVSQRGKGSMDHMNVFCFCECFIWRTQKANTTGGHESHLRFPIITNWNTNTGLFDCLFVFPIEWHPTKNQKMAYTGDFAFLFSFFTLRIERNETMYNGSYFYWPFFVYELGKRKRKTNLPFSIFYYGFGKRKTKEWYIQHNVLFRFSLFYLAKEKTEICIFVFLNMYFVCGLRKRKRILR